MNPLPYGRTSGKSAQEIATQLGIREGQLYEWKKSAMPALAQGDLQAENAALRKENALFASNGTF